LNMATGQTKEKPLLLESALEITEGRTIKLVPKSQEVLSRNSSYPYS